MHRSSLCEVCPGREPLAPPPFPVETYRRTILAFSNTLRSRKPQKHDDAVICIYCVELSELLSEYNDINYIQCDIDISRRRHHQRSTD